MTWPWAQQSYLQSTILIRSYQLLGKYYRGRNWYTMNIWARGAGAGGAVEFMIGRECAIEFHSRCKWLTWIEWVIDWFIWSTSSPIPFKRAVLPLKLQVQHGMMMTVLLTLDKVIIEEFLLELLITCIVIFEYLHFTCKICMLPSKRSCQECIFAVVFASPSLHICTSTSCKC